MNVQQERDTTTIRQTIIFNAPPQDVYEVVMDSKKHESLSGEKADISREAGGAFKAWGDHISGFNLVLQPGRKIVQAWRAHDWWADHYSIATFELRQVEVGTELRFTQIGVPPHRLDGHSRGWIETYWQPMHELFDKGDLSEQTRTASAAARHGLIKATSEYPPQVRVPHARAACLRWQASDALQRSPLSGHGYGGRAG